MKSTGMLLVMALGVMSLSACQTTRGTYYVSATHGDDVDHDGSFGRPFRTISTAAEHMQPGERCLIRGGVYRETVTPAADHLYFGPYKNERVVITGCDVVEGPWQAERDAIMAAPVESRTMQVFVDGERMDLARYPNRPAGSQMLSYDAWDKTVTSTPDPKQKTVGQVEFADMPPAEADAWVGGYYLGRNGPNPFTAACGRIIGSADNRITITDLPFWWRRSVNANSAVGEGVGYIINHRRALDAPREWHWADGVLRLIPPTGADIKQGRVEARTRLWGVDLTGREGIVVERIELQAASVKLADSIDCRVTGCMIRYPAPWTSYDYPQGSDYGGVDDGSCGVFVSGSGNHIADCLIAHSWGSGVRLEGNDNTLENCIVEDINWLGRRMHPVQCFGQNNHVLGNTIRRCGQAGIDGGNRLCGVEKVGFGLDIQYNLVTDVGMLNTDCGFFYINNQGPTPPVNTTVAYNVCVRTHSTRHAFGIYFDNGSCGGVIHHNTVVGGPACDIGIFLHNSGVGMTDYFVANNTVLQTKQASIGCRGRSKNPPASIVFRNNLADNKLIGFTEQDHNRDDAQPGEFVNVEAFDLRLSSDSRAINAGVVIPGITESFTGPAPDLGAYEHGAPRRAAGATWSVGRASVTTP
ncbi:right-handed parallel beta-helix repeat-containing protein [Planctomycetales bacterium ZRK34]|nr:right-handed parallel beta-helix repeat-containing protein [Planctomycetales bacterium ZRK34]